MKTIKEGKNVFVNTTLKNVFLIPKSFSKIPFQEIKDEILGRQYELSITLVGKKRMCTLNKTYRQKDYATDVLSFTADKNLGEIFINPNVAQSKSKNFEMSYGNYLLFLVIHALLHLKGLDHGDKMEKYELTYYNRYRHRYL
jgi:probable rRNA maturation factor